MSHKKEQGRSRGRFGTFVFCWGDGCVVRDARVAGSEREDDEVWPDSSEWDWDWDSETSQLEMLSSFLCL